MNEEQAYEVIQPLVSKHWIHLEGGPAIAGDQLTFTVGGLPELGFFIDLAKALKVSIEDIATDSNDLGEGCPTCGYGGGTEVEVTVRLQ